MSATIHNFVKSQRIRSAQTLADHLIACAEMLKPDTELMAAALIQALFQIASKTRLPGVKARIANSLHAIASLLEMVDKAEQSATPEPL